MKVILNLLNEIDIQFTNNQVEVASQVVSLHGLYKIMEIRTRSIMGNDGAADSANNQLIDVLKRAHFPEEFVTLATSNSHTAARDFMCSRESWDMMRLSAYLSDELLQENVIQTNYQAKVRRLMLDPRYHELNVSGFPECSGFEEFNKNGALVPKFNIQEIANKIIVEKISDLLGISATDLGKYIILKAQSMGIYTAVIRSEKLQLSQLTN